MAFVRSVPGIGPVDQSMWSNEEIREYVAAEAALFRERAVSVAVTGWTLTALLSTRLAGIPLVTEHAGSVLPPVFERGLLPAPGRPVGMPLERWLPKQVRRRLYNAGAVRLDLYTSGFNRIAAELGVEGVPSFAALLLGDLTLVTDVPEVLGVAKDELEAWRPRAAGRYRAGTRAYSRCFSARSWRNSQPGCTGSADVTSRRLSSGRAWFAGVGNCARAPSVDC